MTEYNIPKIKAALEMRTKMRTKKKIAQHLIRIDKGDSTHGYQARWGTKKEQQTKLFSDSLNGGPEGAYKAAEQFILSLNLPSTPMYYRGENFKLDKRNKSGVTGVRQGRKDRPDSWEATVVIGPQGRKSKKTFYVHNEGSEEEAFQLAVEYRKEWEKAVDKGLDALIKFFDTYHFLD